MQQLDSKISAALHGLRSINAKYQALAAKDTPLWQEFEIIRKEDLAFEQKYNLFVGMGNFYLQFVANDVEYPLYKEVHKLEKSNDEYSAIIYKKIRAALPKMQEAKAEMS